MNTLSLERKVFAGFLAALAAFATLAALTWNYSRQTLQSSSYVAHTQEVIGSIGGIESHLHRAEAGQRAYLISGMQSYLGDRNVALGLLHQELDRLSELSADSETQQRRIVALRREVADRVALFNRSIAIYHTHGFAAVQATFATAASPMARVRATTGEMRAEEEGLLAQRQKATRQRMQSAQTGFFALLAALAIISPMLYLGIRSEIRHREKSQGVMQRLIGILDSTPDIVQMSDPDGRAVYLNAAARVQLGIGDADAASVRVESIYPPWVLEKVRPEGIRVATASGSWTGESAVLALDGSEIPVSQVLIAHRQPDGSVAMSTIARSIAERKKTEQVLQQAALYDASNAEALMLYNEHTNREKVLEGTLDILAERHSFAVSGFYAFEEWAGNLRLVSTRGAPGGARPPVKVGMGPVGTAARDMRMIHIARPDITRTDLSVEPGFVGMAPAALLFSPVTYSDHLLGVMALGSTEPLTERDLTFIESLSRQLGVALYNIRQLDDMRLLTEQLRARSEEIALKNKEVEQASRMKSEFLANMSHELRTPLNAVIGFAEIIRDGMAGPVTARQNEYAGDILSSGQHLLSLINDILDLSKIESGHMTLDLEPIDPAVLVGGGLVVVKERATTQRIALHHTIEPGLGKVCLDTRKTKQIIYNLLSNAVKFTPPDGTIHVSLRRVPLNEVRRQQEAAGMRRFAVLDPDHDEFLEISVSDTGIGISPESLQRLFEPFTQIDSSYSRKYEGSGLGLALVGRLADLHGGGAAAQSDTNKGSCFTVWLPWRKPEGGDLDASVGGSRIGASATAAPVRGRLAPLMLVVEDEPQAAKILRAQLESEGYRTVHTETAETGLQLAAELHPDVIVLDVILPGVDGWEMLSQLKLDPATSGIPVVIVSVTDDISRGFALGASQVLTKPVMQEDLVAALDILQFEPDQSEVILVADDDPKSVSLLSLQLKAAGHIPIQAYGGREAIALATSEKPALVLLDLMMPDVSGFDVVQALHEQPVTAGIPIVILTAKIVTAEDRARLNGRVQRIIEKTDFNPALLRREVRSALLKREVQKFS